jgi:hypothetical protein
MPSKESFPELPAEQLEELDKLNIIEKAKHALSPARFAIWLARLREMESKAVEAESDKEKKIVERRIKAGDQRRSKA